MAIIPKPAFPNVPQLPGVPQLPRSPRFPPGPAPVLNAVVAVGRLALALTSQPIWGIFKVPAPDVTPPDQPGGLETVVVQPKQPPVIVPDSFSKFSYKQEWSVSTAPVQQGAFASYNKVASPYEITFRMVKIGSLESRKEFLTTLETISASLDLYKIATPERSYLNCNITGFRVTRDGARDAYALTEVEVSFVEVRVVEAQYTSTAANTQNATNPSAKPVSNQGTLNSATPSSRIATAVNAVLSPLRKLASLVGAG